MKKNEAVGRAIEAYRDHIESALEWSNVMSEVGVERPWITVKCSRQECSKFSVRTTNGMEVEPHTHRIRLEIR